MEEWASRHNCFVAPIESNVKFWKLDGSMLKCFLLWVGNNASTLPETNIAPKTQGLEGDISFWNILVSGGYVSFREGNSSEWPASKYWRK